MLLRRISLGSLFLIFALALIGCESVEEFGNTLSSTARDTKRAVF